MPIRLGRFEMPKTLVRNEKTATETYAQFVAEPFEAGYGHTIGNSLRRTLLSSLEGAAITSVKIEGAPHEFTAIPGVVEDVVEIILNLKKVKFKAHDHEPRNLTLSVNKQGAVTAGDIQSTAQCEVLNPEQHICTLDKKMKFDAEFEVKVGRGFATGDENKAADKPIGVIAIDSIFSPVTKVKYAVGRPVSASAPTTTSSSWISGPTDASPLTRPSSSPPQSSVTTLMSSSISTTPRSSSMRPLSRSARRTAASRSYSP